MVYSMASFCFASLLLLVITSSFAEENIAKKYKARLEVKAFIREDSEKYPDLEVEYIGGMDPVMILLNDEGDEVKRVPVAEKSRNDINEILGNHGLARQEEPEQEEAEEQQPDDLSHIEEQTFSQEVPQVFETNDLQDNEIQEAMKRDEEEL